MISIQLLLNPPELWKKDLAPMDGSHHPEIAGASALKGQWSHGCPQVLVTQKRTPRNKWSFPRIGVTPSHHPFLDGFSMKSTIQLLGYHHLQKPPVTSFRSAHRTSFICFCCITCLLQIWIRKRRTSFIWSPWACLEMSTVSDPYYCTKL